MSTDQLRAALAAQMPEYMVPSAFVLLPALPLTPNGKIDRHALPAPAETQPELAAVFVAPTDAVEEVLAGIWADVLGIERVGIHDNFFALGGQSLLGMQVTAQIADLLETELPLRVLFEAPTVAALAAAMLADPAERRRLELTADFLLKLADLPDEEVERMYQDRAEE